MEISKILFMQLKRSFAKGIESYLISKVLNINQKGISKLQCTQFVPKSDIHTSTTENTYILYFLKITFN